MYPAVLLIYFVSAAVILLASLALTVHVSLPHNKNGRASVLYNFINFFLRVFFLKKLNSAGREISHFFRIKYFIIRRDDIFVGQTEGPRSNIENFVPEELHNLRLSSGNINVMKKEECKMNKAHYRHGKGDKNRNSQSASP